MKPRVNVFVHGDVGSGKTSLVRSLERQTPRAAAYPRTDLTVSTWEPTEAEWHNILGNDSAGYDQSMAIQFWDLSGNPILRPVQSLLLTPEALHVQVVDATRLDPASVIDVWNQIHFRVPGSEVILVLTKTDRLVLDIDGFDGVQVRILEELRQNERHQLETAQQLLQHISTLSAAERYTSHITTVVNKRPIVPTHILPVSCKSAKGLRELSRAILTTLLDARKFPYHRLRARLCQDGIPLEEMLDGFRQGPDTLMSLSGLEEVLSPLTPNESFENIIKLLHYTGAIIDFRDVTSDKLEGGRLVCVDPEAFGMVVTSIHVTDIKKTFRIEACQFWPKQTGFKRPSPNLLSKVLERIPCKGLIRESLFPILWQDLEPSETQVLLYLDLLERLGVVMKHLPTLSDCEGLVMPDYPNLSVNRQYLAVTMDTLPDKKPSLNWTSRPISGDLQLGWRYLFPLGAPPFIFKMVAACCQKCCQDRQTYMYQWRYGLLLRLQQGIVCITHEKDHVTVTCRVDANEAGGNTEAVQLLWRLLSPFIEVTTRLLHSNPGLLYQVLLVPDGEAFFVVPASEVTEEVALPLEESFTEWQASNLLAVQCTGQAVEVRADILFPFKDCKLRSKSMDHWLDVANSTNDRNRETGRSPTHGGEFTRHSSYFRGSRRRKRNSSKKKVALKWHLEHEQSSLKEKVTESGAESVGSVGQELSKQAKCVAPGHVLKEETCKSNTTDDNEKTRSVAKSPGDSTSLTDCSLFMTDETAGGRANGLRSRKSHQSSAADGDKDDGVDGARNPISVSEETMKQAASVFTSTVLARGVLQFVEEERASNPKWKGVVSHKQILAARRVATLPSTRSQHPNNSLYQAAQAVIDAINSTVDQQPGHSKSGKSNKSFLCSLF